jgi:hypothetical protein
VRVLGWGWRLFCRVVLGFWPSPLPGWLGWRAHAERLAVRVVFALRTRDVACPFRLMRRSIFRRIPLQSDGPFVHVEILAKANFLGHIIAEELPLDVAARPNPNPRADRQECWRVMAHPEFGPTFLPEEPAVSAPSEQPAET